MHGVDLIGQNRYDIFFPHSLPRNIFRTYCSNVTFHYLPHMKQGDQKLIIDSLCCSSARKSLVKGERFMRTAEKPELTSTSKITVIYVVTQNIECGYQTENLCFYCG